MGCRLLLRSRNPQLKSTKLPNTCYYFAHAENIFSLKNLKFYDKKQNKPEQKILPMTNVRSKFHSELILPTCDNYAWFESLTLLD